MKFPMIIFLNFSVEEAFKFYNKSMGSYYYIVDLIVPY